MDRLISEKAVIDAICNNKGRFYTVNAIKKIPSATGHWINAKVGKLFPSNDFKCSECGNILDFNGVNCGRGNANYCPNCGADMRGNKE